MSVRQQLFGMETNLIADPRNPDHQCSHPALWQLPPIFTGGGIRYVPVVMAVICGTNGAMRGNGDALQRQPLVFGQMNSARHAHGCVLGSQADHGEYFTA